MRIVSVAVPVLVESVRLWLVAFYIMSRAVRPDRVVSDSPTWYPSSFDLLILMRFTVDVPVGIPVLMSPPPSLVIY